MDLLKRELAPIVEQAWAAIDAEAKRVLTLNLAGRKLVDFDGPHGWKYAASNTGRLSLLERQPEPGVFAGVRVVQALLEVRVPFELSIMELDSVPRGARNVPLDPVVAAAEKTARVEDDAIFNGLDAGGMTGIIPASPHAPLTLPAAGERYPQVVVEAREILREAGIDGPYALALSPQAYKEISQATDDGYPVRKRIDREVIDGPIVLAPSIKGAVLLSVRGGDFELIVGQDLSVGYAGHDRHNVELYLTESFTFRILEPAAAIVLKSTD